MKTALLAILTFVALLKVGVAQAGEPAYVGKWGKDAEQCKNGQEINNAPMLITRNGYNSHEVHCTFSSIKQSGKTWTMKTKRSVEGDQQTGKMTLSVAGETLTMDGTWKLQRC
ncbi:MAG: hypothetical protein ACR2PG_14790 [Hyphomicrobiaceae bacterium]